MPEGSCFRTLFQSQRVHLSQTLLKSSWQHFSPNFEFTKYKLSQKTSVSVKFEISVQFGNTLTADHMYSHHNQENLWQHVQRPLSQKRETCSGIFIQFLDSTQNFAHFQKNDQVHSLNIQDIIESEKYVDLNARKLLFQNTLPESMCARVTNNVQVCTPKLLSNFPINKRQIELGSISFSQI